MSRAKCISPTTDDNRKTPSSRKARRSFFMRQNFQRRRVLYGTNSSRGITLVLPAMSAKIISCTLNSNKNLWQSSSGMYVPSISATTQIASNSRLPSEIAFAITTTSAGNLNSGITLSIAQPLYMRPLLSSRARRRHFLFRQSPFGLSYQQCHNSSKILQSANINADYAVNPLDRVQHDYIF